MDKEQSASIGRRGLVATLGALGGAAVAKLISPGRAEAGHNTNIAYDSQTVMHLDVTNTTAGSSRISSNISGTAAAVILNNYPVGISRPDGMLGRTMYTTSNCAGVAGTCENATGGIGVHGGAKSSTGTGVFGFAGSVVSSEPQPGGAGVYGVGPFVGVQGKSNAIRRGWRSDRCGSSRCPRQHPERFRHGRCGRRQRLGPVWRVRGYGARPCGGLLAG